MKTIYLIAPLLLAGARDNLISDLRAVVATKGKANKAKSLIKASNAHKRQGTRMIKAKSKGNNSVQQNDMSWSKRIRGREARTQINVNTRALDLIPKTKPEINPSKVGDNANCERSLLTISNHV